jgi:hypothetical protein
MNEQIKEFLVKARVQDRGYFIYQYGGTTGHQSIEKAIDLEKFAELIVKECGIVADNWVANEDNGKNLVSDRLKQHFAQVVSDKL